MLHGVVVVALGECAAVAAAVVHAQAAVRPREAASLKGGER
jgi:hypothetical protein